MLEWFIFSVIGMVAGFFAGLLGVGGGIIVVPALLFVFGIQGVAESEIVHLAIGTSLMTIVITACSSTYHHEKNSNIDWRLVQRLFLGLMLGGLSGAYLLTLFSGNVLKVCFAVYAVVVAIRLWRPSKVVQSKLVLNKAALFLSGGFIGTVSSVVGIGGGTLLVPLLMGNKLTIQRAIGTSSACGFFIASAAIISFFILDALHLIETKDWQAGFIHWPAFLGIVSMSIIFAATGAKWVDKLPIIVLRRLFSVILILVALTLINRSL